MVRVSKIPLERSYPLASTTVNKQMSRVCGLLYQLRYVGKITHILSFIRYEPFKIGLVMSPLQLTY